MDLYFPALGGGASQGLNDAGIETYKGRLEDYLARECGQNTSDAKRPDAPMAELHFTRHFIAAKDVPALASLRHSLNTCMEDAPSENRTFFQDALNSLAGPDVSVLRIADYGTTGLTGGDKDKTQAWFGLVKSNGVSNKGITSGGSFGIGKSSPFAASKARTVFYGTRLENDAVAFQGVSKLVTHRDKDGLETQGTGYIGDRDEAEGDLVFRAVRDEERIPQCFRRTEVGTDIWVLGYDGDTAWADTVAQSIVQNFWFAINEGRIAFRVQDVAAAPIEINQGTLAAQLERYSYADDFTAHMYYKAIHSTPRERTLTTCGASRFFIHTSEDDVLPKRVYMMRKTGMLIRTHTPRGLRIPYAGVFICDDERGNALLRSMEPPAHNDWEPGRRPDVGKKVLNEIHTWIRSELKELSPEDEARTFNERELAQFLPDDTLDDGHPGRPVTEQAHECLEPRPRGIEDVAPQRVVTSSPGESGDDTGNAEGDQGVRRRRKPESTAPDATTPREGRKAGSGGGGSDAHHVSSRCFRPSGQDAYELVLRSDSHFHGNLEIVAIGEDGAQEPVGLSEASVISGSHHQLVVMNSQIHDVAITPDAPLRLAIRLSEDARHSLKAIPRQ